MEIPLSGRQWTVVDLQGNKLKAGTLRLTERPVYFVAQESDGKDCRLAIGDCRLAIENRKSKMSWGVLRAAEANCVKVARRVMMI